MTASICRHFITTLKIPIFKILTWLSFHQMIVILV